MQARSGWMRLLRVAMILMAGFASEASADEAKSELTDVTLYRDQAQITRTVAVPKGEGSIELVVSGLPQEIRPGSLFAEGGQGIDVRAVRFRERVTGQEPRAEIRELDEQIEAKRLELEEVATMKGLIEKRVSYLDKLENFSATTGTAELSKGVLDAEQLQEMTKFTFEERKSAAKEQLELNSSERRIKKELTVLQQKRAEIAGQTQSRVREAVLFLDRRNAQADAVQLTYLVGNCGWSPSYNARGELKSGKVRLEYNALIRQMTGEDWEGVNLTLSTASPMISASGPQVAGFPVSLKQLAKGGREVNGFDLKQALSNTSSGGASQVSQDYTRLNQAQFANQRLLNIEASSLDRNADIAWSGNVLANRIQLLELCEPVDKLMPTMVTASPEQGLSISYTIEGGVSLQSRADQQMTRIMQTELEGSFYHSANPVLTPFVYREAEVVNTSGSDLLSGPVNVYLNGSFVGRTEVVSVTRDQTFVLGFGADPQLSASRQLVEREQEQQGGNTRISFEYRLAVENYGKEATEVRVFDRLPNFANGDDVSLTLVSGFEGLSKDPVYLRIDRPNGILRWDVTADAGTTGEQATLVPYTYTLEFDRNYGLSSEVDDRLKDQFKMQQRERLTK